MSTAKPADGGSTESEQKKTVTIVAYGALDTYDSLRDMADTLDPTRDYYERKYQRNRSVEVVVLDEDGEEAGSEKVFNSAVRDALVEHGVAADNVEVREEHDVKRPYRHSPDKMASDLRKEIGRRLPDELPGGLSQSWYDRKWQDESHETKVRIRSQGLDNRRVLVHRSKRGGRRKYDSDRKHPSAQFTIELGPADGDLVEKWNRKVVEAFIRELHDEYWVERVRVTDCAETVEREGDCFDL